MLNMLKMCSYQNETKYENMNRKRIERIQKRKVKIIYEDNKTKQLMQPS